FVVVDDFLGGLEAELCLDTALGPSVGRVEVCGAMTVMFLYKLPDAKIEEVGAHFRGLLERYNLLVGPNLFRLDGHVGDDLEVGARSDYELEDRLERRMVQTGKEFAGLNRLKVRREDVAVTIRGLVGL